MNPYIIVKIPILDERYLDALLISLVHQGFAPYIDDEHENVCFSCSDEEYETIDSGDNSDYSIINTETMLPKEKLSEQKIIEMIKTSLDEGNDPFVFLMNFFKDSGIEEVPKNIQKSFHEIIKEVLKGD